MPQLWIHSNIRPDIGCDFAADLPSLTAHQLPADEYGVVAGLVS